ncbi:hypothetical protein HJG60_007774 [Phyllostomus discolor]|uniref:Uncharacterized protein n=1 Tax=Phyllostomus discolor TaxID=89673 RepID=A0A834EV33_9CHIR|nr:hypothetical protein HJG60_007774 [Phyllostomus discolor]
MRSEVMAEKNRKDTEGQFIIRWKSRIGRSLATWSSRRPAKLTSLTCATASGVWRFKLQGLLSPKVTLQGTLAERGSRFGAQLAPIQTLIAGQQHRSPADSCAWPHRAAEPRVPARTGTKTRLEQEIAIYRSPLGRN